MSEKVLRVTGKVKGKIESHDIEMQGTIGNERLTPKMAIRAALVAFGHRCGIKVSDGETCYRIYANSYRKLDLKR